MANDRWRDQAHCVGMPTDIFFSDDAATIRHALAVCGNCPVSDFCLEAALQNDEREGIFGGMLARDRKALRRQRLREGTLQPLPRRRPACATFMGYQRHVRDGEVPCLACKNAHAAYEEVRATRRPPRAVVRGCGTYEGYRRHLALNSDPCVDCIAAHERLSAAMR